MLSAEPFPTFSTQFFVTLTAPFSGQEDSMRAANATPHDTPAVREHPDWGELLIKAVNTPGVMSDAYRRFWNYSVGNQILAWLQCAQRGIDLGPIHTFMGWKGLGRFVKKGEKALTLCMPVTVRSRYGETRPDAGARTEQTATAIPAGAGDERTKPMVKRTCFVYRPNWFVLSQTEGKEYIPAELPEWSEARALDVLQIERIPFRHADGNAQGYASHRQIAVSPVAFTPARTLMHELAHIVLGHTEELQRMDDDNSRTPRDLREVEAECVALICCSSLALGGEEFSRGYIQHWLSGQTIPERSAQKIFKAADQILRAGRAAADSATSSDPA
jgi:antirestriction protein ArdC